MQRQTQYCPRGEVARNSRLCGFTMVELLVAIAIVGMLMAVTVPGSIRFYESMQYRQSVRDVLTTLGTARHRAIDLGQIQDVQIDPFSKQLILNDEVSQLPSGIELSVTTAAEVNRVGRAVIRFYPQGGSSGGDIVIETPARSRGVKISVDWLMGGASQASYDLD